MVGDEIKHYHVPTVSLDVVVNTQQITKTVQNGRNRLIGTGIRLPPPPPLEYRKQARSEKVEQS